MNAKSYWEFNYLPLLGPYIAIINKDKLQGVVDMQTHESVVGRRLLLICTDSETQFD